MTRFSLPLLPKRSPKQIPQNNPENGDGYVRFEQSSVTRGPLYMFEIIPIFVSEKIWCRNEKPIRQHLNHRNHSGNARMATGDGWSNGAYKKIIFYKKYSHTISGKFFENFVRIFKSFHSFFSFIQNIFSKNQSRHTRKKLLNFLNFSKNFSGQFFGIIFKIVFGIILLLKK